MTDHTSTPAQPEKVPVAWASFTERGYVRFWTTDKVRAVAEMAAGSFAVRPYTVDDLMGMVVRASAVQPPAAPVDSGSMHGEYTPVTVRASTAAPVDILPAQHRDASKWPSKADMEVSHSRSSAATEAVVDELAEFLCDEYEGEIGSFSSFNIGIKDRWRDLVRAMLARVPAEPQPAPLMSGGSIFTFLRERMEDETSASLSKACLYLADHLRVLRAVPQPLSRDERHAVEHARYQVQHASPDNPDCHFDYGLVLDLVRAIDRAYPLSRPKLCGGGQ